ncbi:MAG: MFS transporter [Deltaproteobacteria bacterium]|nr:MFS transporter [Deltaproteobacteria bacterium]MBW2362044.1 MFS transporter [Deltaproteobacteria bacterium]
MSARTWYTLGLLMVIYAVNHIDRQVMYILGEPVREELGLSDGQMGWILGGGFALFYAFMGIPIGRIADRANRRNLIAIALALWSAFTVASGRASGFLQLVAARIGVGIGEAGCTPPAHSMVSDLVPPERRASALSFYALGIPLGTLFGLTAGGYLADTLGWRWAFYLVGAPGVALALLARLTLHEPERGATEPGADTGEQSLGDVFGFIAGLPSVLHSLLGNALQTLPLAAAAAFNPAYLQRVHGLSITETGLSLGLISGLVGGASVFASGRISDRLSRRDERWLFWLPLAGALVSIPFSAVAYTTGVWWVAVAGIGAATLFNHLYSALGHAQVQSLVKPRMRAMMSAIALFGMNLVGFGVGPLAVGYISDAFGGGDQIRVALLVLVLACMPWACIHYGLAARTYRADLLRKREA